MVWAKKKTKRIRPHARLADARHWFRQVARPALVALIVLVCSIGCIFTAMFIVDACGKAVSIFLYLSLWSLKGFAPQTPLALWCGKR